MRHVLAVAGSLRRDSFNRSLLRAAAELAPPGMTVAVEEDLASVPLFDEDLESTAAGGPGPVARLRAKVASADGLLIATPEYNQSIPGVLKNAIDWLSRDAAGEVLAGKPVAIVGASSGPWGTRLSQAALRQVLYATGSPVLPGPALYLREARRLFDDAGRLTDASTRERLAAVLAAFDRWMDRLAGD
jgi:chromate reductase, NAD(P)H dehydrogenase (quinone)